jgi:hypothetical protein
MTSKGWYPKAIAKPIPSSSKDGPIVPRLAILHVRDGLGPSLSDQFTEAEKAGGSGIEAHFYIRLDGTIEQYRSIFVECDANYLANSFAVSIETEGKATGTWSAPQLASIRVLLLWIHEAAPTVTLARAEKWDGSGVGYHIQFGTPGKWTPIAKSCPGLERIKQFENNIVPWMKQLARVPAPIKTPNITAFRLAKTNAEKRAAAGRIVRNGSIRARAAAAEWLDADGKRAAAKAMTDTAAKSLLALEVK